MQPKRSLKPALLRLGAAVILLAAAVGILYFRQARQNRPAEQYDVTVIPPTCTDAGYSLYTHRESGATFADDMTPASGHRFGPWQLRQEGGALTPEVACQVCTVCAAEEERVTYPETSIPLLALEGDLTRIGKKSEVPIRAELMGGDLELSAFATLKYQGHSTLQYDKKNYTLKLYRDEDLAEKYKLSISHWNPENKYILKANYIDPSQCRNLLCADIWAEVAASRVSVPDQFRSLSNYGAVDGFPIALYINREYQGLYTFNLHKDDDLFGMEEGEEHAILIANDASAPEGLFRDLAAFEEDSPWEVEFCGTEDSAWAKDKLNRLISLVMHSDDETFREELPAQLDVPSAIDYLLCLYAFGLTNYEENDLILVCYGSGQPFTVSMYDMDSAFGLSEDGASAAPPEDFLPQYADGRWDSGTGNLLWDRLLQNFQPELRQRYQQLRETVLDPDALCGRVLAYTGAIPESLTESDNAVYPHPNTELSQTEQITGYITRRIALLDDIFSKGAVD